MTQTLLDQVKQLFDFLFNLFGFVIADHRYDSENFGNAYVVLQSDDLRFRFINDRSDIFVEVASIIEPDNWFDLSKVLQVLNEKLEKHLALSSTKDLASYAKLIQNEYGSIKVIFSSKEFKDTKVRLENLEKTQVQTMFKKFGLNKA